jgi:hypothetical protein
VLEMLCTCTADGCSTAPMPSGTPATQYPAMIDGALDATGSMLTGTMLPGRATVLLQKQ